MYRILSLPHHDIDNPESEYSSHCMLITVSMEESDVVRVGSFLQATRGQTNVRIQSIHYYSEQDRQSIDEFGSFLACKTDRFKLPTHTRIINTAAGDG